MPMFKNYITNEWTNDATEQRGVRWFIKPGFAGCNTDANNGPGYISQRRAEATIAAYQDEVEPDTKPKLYLACRQCGEVFDDINVAWSEHMPLDCGSEQGWDIVTEDEAF